MYPWDARKCNPDCHMNISQSVAFPNMEVDINVTVDGFTKPIALRLVT